MFQNIVKGLQIYLWTWIHLDSPYCQEHCCVRAAPRNYIFTFISFMSSISTLPLTQILLQICHFLLDMLLN
jgi:hypothetical protein